MSIRLALLACLFVSGLGPAAAGADARIQLDVDAREAPRRILHARLVLPAKPGTLRFHYPKWIPGEHGPTGPINNLTGLRLRAAGRDVAWERDATDPYAFRCTVPAGARALEVELDYVLPPRSGKFTAGGSTTPQLGWINWNQVLVYPESRDAQRLVFAARLQLPEGWDFGTALPVARRQGGDVTFEPVTLETLVDSPVLAAAHFRTLALTEDDPPAVQIHMACDSEAGLAAPPDLVAAWKRLVAEADALFGARPFRRYHFLLSLSDHTAHFGLEHHESSDNRVTERALVDPDLRLRHANLLPHEFVHSWNGKHRRPADLVAADFQGPLRTDLLWVYEGLTQYLAFVLGARAGLRTLEQSYQHLAAVAARLDVRPGRTWRPLLDTAVASQIVFQAPDAWESWRRAADFYDEGLLVWLEADVLIRTQTQGRRSLDDFCKLFLGGAGGRPSVVPYTFDDVVAALGRVHEHDWRGFLRERIVALRPQAPLGGIDGGGWRLAYRDSLPALQKALESAHGSTDVRYSIGIHLDKEGRVVDAIPGLPAAQAGVAPGAQLVAVNGRRWSPRLLRDALRSTRGGAPLELLSETDEFFTTHRLEYGGGERYPHLERDPARLDVLGAILAPASPGATARR